MRDHQSEIGSELSNERERLGAARTLSERDVASFFAVLALLAKGKLGIELPTRDVPEGSDAFEDAPCVINFERAKAELLARREFASYRRPQGTDDGRPRLRVFCGEQSF